MHWGAWALTGLFALLWALIAGANASILLTRWLGKQGDQSPSFIPLIGGIFASIAIFNCPWSSPWKLGVLIAALLLDVGSLPYAFLSVIALLMNAAASAWQTGLRGLVARAPRALLLGTGFLIWMGVWIGGGVLAARMGWELQWRLMGFMILFWPLYGLLLWRLRKPRPTVLR